MEDELKEKLRREVESLEDSLSASERQVETSGEAGKIDPFSLFGKIAAVVIVIALLVGGGIYLGQSMNKGSNPTPTPMQEETQTSPTVSNSPQTTTAPTSDKATPLDRSTTAGGAKGTSYKVYQADYPSSWIVSKEANDITDKLTLTKGAYSISIYQAPMGGGGCTYPGDAPSEMAQTYKSFANIQGSTYKLRRSWNEEGATITYTVCASSDGKTFGSPTSYGAISVKAPNPADASTISEIDSILASLTTK